MIGIHAPWLKHSDIMDKSEHCSHNCVHLINIGLSIIIIYMYIFLHICIAYFMILSLNGYQVVTMTEHIPLTKPVCT